ncbi:MAG: M2 family metallopeptidase [Cytophagales bacterium]|nr:M2 family metallopeptidase [Armatimonadota bacterium]
MNPEFLDFLSSHRARVESLEIESSDAWWQANIAASPEADARAATAQKALSRLYADPHAFARLKKVETGSLAPDEKRQHALLVNTFTGNQMEDAVIEEMVDTERRVESTYNRFRPPLRGEPTGDNAIRDILRDSEDSVLRRDAWEASKQVGVEVEKDVLRLVRLRNTEARRLGYANYYQMALSLQELDQEELFALLAEVAAQTDPHYKAFKGRLDADLAARFGILPADLCPWHYSDPFFQEAPTGEVPLDRFFAGKNLEMLTGRFFTAIGLEVGDILGRSDLYERPHKCQHAFCVHVGRYDDVRVLCNCTDSERWMGTMLHEFGHAVYDKYLGDDLPFFLREAAHTLTTEAIAMLMGRLSRNAAWLSRYAEVDVEEAAAVEASAGAEQSAQLLVFARWCLVMTHFERALYEDPSQDLNRLWWEIVQRFQHLTPPEGRDAPDWAAKLHTALAPVYYQNYLLGEMFASQLLEQLRTSVLPAGSGDDGLVSSPLVGTYLTEKVFAKGARLPWNELIAEATGEPLSPRHFVRHLRS